MTAERIIHVWLTPRPEQLSRAWLALTTYEDQQTAQAMTSARRRTEWLAGRALLRRCLAWHTGLDAQALFFSKTPAGKPVLAQQSAPAFNLSHGPDWLACAVADAACIGLDIDSTMRRNRIDDIAARYFHALEQSALHAADNDTERRRRFFLRWTLKEAYIKALGSTIAETSLSSIPFAAETHPPQALFTPPPGDWHFGQRQIDPHHHLALACQWPNCDTDGHTATHSRFWLWEPEADTRIMLTDELPLS